MILGWIVERKLRRLRNAGFPTDLEALRRDFQNQTHRDDTEAWMRLLDLFSSDAFDADARRLDPWGLNFLEHDPMTPEWDKASLVREFLEKHSGHLRELRDLASKHRAVAFSSNFLAEFEEIDFDFFSHLRKILRTLGLAAQMACRDRDSSSVRANIDAMLGLARSIEACPFLVSLVVSLANESIAITELQYALEANVLSMQDLELLHARIQARTHWHARWLHGLVTERVYLMCSSNDCDDKYSLKSSLQLKGLKSIRLLKLFDSLEAMGRSEDLNRFSAATHRYRDLFNRKFGVNYSGLDGMSPAIVDREMRMRLATLALGLRMYQKKYQVFPGKLESLREVGIAVNEIKPIGPRPFGYRIEGDSAVLWGFDSKQIRETPKEPWVLSLEGRDRSQLKDPWIWTFRH